MMSNEKLELLCQIEDLENELDDLKAKRKTEHREAIQQAKDLRLAECARVDLREEFTIAAMQLAKANALLDEVEALADVRPMRVDVGLELDGILAKRREVE